MKLADWLRKYGVSRIEFSRRLGVTPGAVSQLCNHESVWMSRDTAKAIARETQGAVTPNDFLPDVAGEDKMLEASMSHSVPLAVEAIRARRDRHRHRRRRPRERGRSGHGRWPVHARENGLHHPQLLRHRLCAALGRRGASPASAADGGRKRRAARHRLHRHRRCQTRPDHRHFGRTKSQYRARPRQQQFRRERFRAARPCLSADRARRRRADALRPYRGGGRSLQIGRPAAGRRDLRTRQ